LPHVEQLLQCLRFAARVAQPLGPMPVSEVDVPVWSLRGAVLGVLPASSIHNKAMATSATAKMAASISGARRGDATPGDTARSIGAAL
jgi:hypothetical protein